MEHSVWTRLPGRARGHTCAIPSTLCVWTLLVLLYFLYYPLGVWRSFFFFDLSVETEDPWLYKRLDATCRILPRTRRRTSCFLSAKVSDRQRESHHILLFPVLLCKSAGVRYDRRSTRILEKTWTGHGQEVFYAGSMRAFLGWINKRQKRKMSDLVKGNRIVSYPGPGC
jgi:hypothetical protein